MQSYWKSCTKWHACLFFSPLVHRFIRKQDCLLTIHYFFLLCFKIFNSPCFHQRVLFLLVFIKRFYSFLFSSKVFLSRGFISPCFHQDVFYQEVLFLLVFIKMFYLSFCIMSRMSMPAGASTVPWSKPLSSWMGINLLPMPSSTDLR